MCVEGGGVRGGGGGFNNLHSLSYLICHYTISTLAPSLVVLLISVVCTNLPFSTTVQQFTNKPRHKISDNVLYATS